MMCVQLADRLYREHGIITTVKNGRFVKFEDYLEKEEASAGTEGQFKNTENN